MTKMSKYIICETFMGFCFGKEVEAQSYEEAKEHAQLILDREGYKEFCNEYGVSGYPFSVSPIKNTKTPYTIVTGPVNVDFECPNCGHEHYLDYLDFSKACDIYEGSIWYGEAYDYECEQCGMDIKFSKVFVD